MLPSGPLETLQVSYEREAPLPRVAARANPAFVEPFILNIWKIYLVLLMEFNTDTIVHLIGFAILVCMIYYFRCQCSCDGRPGGCACKQRMSPGFGRGFGKGFGGRGCCGKCRGPGCGCCPRCPRRQ